MDNLYFFILGRNPTLSIAEIMSQINADQDADIRGLSNEVLVLETREKLDCQNLQERLGGTIKIGTILTQINADFTLRSNRSPTSVGRTDADLFLKEIPAVIKKVYFGFSFYKLDEKFNLSSLKFQIKSLALKIKKELKEKGISSRWVESKETVLSSVIIQKNKLLTRGAEFVFLIGEKEILLGKTLTCQQFEEYQRFDFGRPARKIEEGMMPPKLAKIMINLVQLSEGGTILDPFCGSGTILQEAALLDYGKIIGSDISNEAVNNTRKNLEWLAAKIKDKKQKIKNTIENLKTFQSDVRNLSQKIPEDSIDAIVTEPYLGPVKFSNFQPSTRAELGAGPVSYRPPNGRTSAGFPISNLIKELSELYLTAFQEFKKVLKKDGRVVIIFPVFKIGNQLNFLLILDKIKKMGWQVINPLPEELRKNPVIRTTDRDSIIYSRPDQIVLREIFVFKLE